MAAGAVSVASEVGGGKDQLLGLAGGHFTSAGTGLAVFVVASLAAARERRDAAQDLYGAQPVAARVRTQAALLSLGSAVLAGAALIAIATIALAGADGALALEGERYGLRPLELAQGPLYLAFAGAFGVLIGCWTRRAYPTVLGALLFVPPMTWWPWIVVGDGVPRGFVEDWLDGASVAWHLVGLAGLATLAAAGALARHDRRPRIALLVLAGLCATVAGVALGLPGPPPGGYVGS